MDRVVPQRIGAGASIRPFLTARRRKYRPVPNIEPPIPTKASGMSIRVRPGTYGPTAQAPTNQAAGMTIQTIALGTSRPSERRRAAA